MNDLISWTGAHVFDLISAVGIISGLCYTSVSFQESARARRIDNLLKLTEQHRNIWEKIQGNPALARIRADDTDLIKHPVTMEEAQFVTFLILHIHCWYRAMLDKEVVSLEGMKRDVRGILSRPVPRHVWEQRKSYLDHDFREFVDTLLNE
ncbi:hypothetical protein [Prosthecobacter sp.]|uniref:hypothetical protein n=1 Tax=Prosthecobacter sp. TaxID=1965333 RepID=UPI003783D69A